MERFIECNFNLLYIVLAKENEIKIKFFKIQECLAKGLKTLRDLDFYEKELGRKHPFR